MARIGVQVKNAVVLREVYQNVEQQWSRTRPVYQIVASTVKDHVAHLQGVLQQEGHDLSETAEAATKRITDEIVKMLSEMAYECGVGGPWKWTNPITRLSVFNQSRLTNVKSVQELIEAAIEEVEGQKSGAAKVNTPAPMLNVRREPTPDASETRASAVRTLQTVATNNVA